MGAPASSRLHRHAGFYFAALLAFAVAAFWPTWFAPPKVEADWHVHLHGIAMFLWMVLLVAQAGLIRAGHRGVHRALGRVSWVLAPTIAISTLLLVNYRIRTRAFDAEAQYFLWVILSLVVVFMIAFGMAMHHRHRPMLHARYMVCTALATIDPIFARIFYITLGVEPPMMQVMTYVLMDGLLLWLAYVDWRDGGPRVFAKMLGVFLVAQAPTFFIPQAAWWPEFGRWYGSLPLP